MCCLKRGCQNKVSIIKARIRLNATMLVFQALLGSFHTTKQSFSAGITQVKPYNVLTILAISAEGCLIVGSCQCEKLLGLAQVV